MITGGIISIIKKTSGSLRSLILHFAAGVVFSVVGVEIPPNVIKLHSPVTNCHRLYCGISNDDGCTKILWKAMHKKRRMQKPGSYLSAC